MDFDLNIKKVNRKMYDIIPKTINSKVYTDEFNIYAGMKLTLIMLKHKKDIDGIYKILKELDIRACSIGSERVINYYKEVQND